PSNRHTWQSSPLTSGQEYQFTIPIATAPWPDGVETKNSDVQAATADSSVPTGPVLTARIT
ncbi:MAG: hypothetical protein KAX19_05990, partial [Candidatus Brocadiae bacterium]|nr:hypothetical protein [Candidatus Brocadiia bacterium]